MLHVPHIFFKSLHSFTSIRQDRYSLNSDVAELYVSVFQGQNSILTHSIGSVSQKIFLIIENDATCTINIQDNNAGKQYEHQTIEYHILLQSKSICHIHLLVTEAYNLSLSVYVYLQGRDSQAFINGAYAISRNQNLSIKTFQNHIGPYTKSELVFKGMLKDQARALYEGLIFIGADAKKTYAAQENKNILLSKQATVISIPAIEVLQHDVQCFHGSAIGRFDREQLWYLQNKGLSEQQSFRLLINSFFGTVIENFENREVVGEVICHKMS